MEREGCVAEVVEPAGEERALVAIRSPTCITMLFNCQDEGSLVTLGNEPHVLLYSPVNPDGVMKKHFVPMPVHVHVYLIFDMIVNSQQFNS